MGEFFVWMIALVVPVVLIFSFAGGSAIKGAWSSNRQTKMLQTIAENLNRSSDKTDRKD
ncbi:MAG: hypothetical protein ABL901_03525 [Hyphomicrobiaceae bacterium]